MVARYQDEVADQPWPVDGFVGRQAELNDIITALLGSVQLLTLVGSGGIGKTRLAAEATARYRKARRTAVHWVGLGRLPKGADIAAVEEEVAQAVVDADFSGRPLWQALVDTFTEQDSVGRPRQTVLVLDNCEHVLAGAGDLIARLLEAVPRLSILATSREAIGWVDEQVAVVPPLSQQHGLALFRHRSELARHPITSTEEVAIADKICRHVHNNPLYIRLAAARLMRQPLAVILRELSGEDDKRMRWSHGPRVGAEARHRGISDVIAWSYDLCSPEERLLFERLSVFAAGHDINPEDEIGAAVDVGADLEAIEAVCSDLEPNGAVVRLAKADIESLLERLVDQSLVSAHMTPSTVRYSLLESLRIFAKRQLRERSTEESDEPARLAEQHRHYYRDKVVHAAATWYSPAEQDLLDWARAAWNNILTAIDSSVATPSDAAVGLEICTGLLALRLPFFKGSFREMRRWTERALHATGSLHPQPVELRIQAMALLVWLILCQGEREAAERMLEECVAACTLDTDDPSNWRHTTESDIGLPASVEFAWGVELLVAHRDPAAITVLGRARAKFDGSGEPGGATMSELFACLAAGLVGTSRQAFELVPPFLDRASASGASWAKSWAELAWAVALTKHGKPAEAADFVRIALTHQLLTRDQWGGLWAVQFRAWSLAQLIADALAGGKPDRGAIVALATETAQLNGGAKTLRSKLGVDINELGPFADETEKASAVARDVLGDEAFTAAETRGSLLRPELGEVLRLALGTLPAEVLRVRVPIDKSGPSSWHELTSAESEVATMAAAGWTNSAIAARRGTSVRTVDTQVAAILQKLVTNSRADIIGFVPKTLLREVRAEAARRQRS
jgi:predicted ATPase/DNA-binding CsgD family transcriptional regulator